MQLSTFDRVFELVRQRHKLGAERESAATTLIKVELLSNGNGKYGISGIGHTYRYEDAAFSAAVQPAVLAELDRRLEANAKALADLGVEVDTAI